MNTYTGALLKRMPAAGDSSWDDEWYDNEKIDDFVFRGLQGVNKIVSGGLVSSGSGLSVNYAAMVVVVGGRTYSISASSVSVTAASLNYVYVDSTGAVTTALAVPTGDFIPLALVDAGAAAVDRVGDARAMIMVQSPNPPSGVEIFGGISGLELANNATDADHDLDIAPGACMDSSGIHHMVLASGITKQLDASFAEGSDSGMLLNGTIANDTLYHVYLITKADGTADVGAVADGDSIAAYLPSGFVHYRWLLPVKTDGSANIRPFAQNQDVLTWDTGFEFMTGLTHTSYQSTDFSSVVPAGRVRSVQIFPIYSSVPDSLKVSLSGSEDDNSISAGGGPNPSWASARWICLRDGGTVYTKTSGNGINLWVKAIEIIR